MKRFLPRYERMSTRIHGATIQLFLHESGLRDPIPSTRIPDGTLRFPAMLAVLFSPSPPPLLCLEEPELGIHPDAITLLGELLVEASSRMQLVVTTHSDALLSTLGNRVGSILVCDIHGYGTTIERLDPGRLAFWLKDYTPWGYLADRRNRGKSVSRLTIYVEGGGTSAGQRKRLREGMDVFLADLKDMARKRRRGLRLVPCGGRRMAYEAFANARDHAEDGETVVLLVDSEAPVTAAAPAAHLRERQGDQWELAGVPDDHIHLRKV